MKNSVTFLIIAIAVLALITTFIIVNPAYLQTTYSEEYKSKHDGGDREEYEQELAYSDPEFMYHQ